jgi:hypothetical protein
MSHTTSSQVQNHCNLKTKTLAPNDKSLSFCFLDSPVDPIPPAPITQTEDAKSVLCPSTPNPLESSSCLEYLSISALESRLLSLDLLGLSLSVWGGPTSLCSTDFRSRLFSRSKASIFSDNSKIRLDWSSVPEDRCSLVLSISCSG